MYVRWTRWKLSGGSDKRHALGATLVEAFRVEGAPRQRQVCALGHIDEARRDNPADRFAFWWSAAQALDGVNLEPAPRATIEANLAQRITPVGAEAFEDQREWARLAILSPEAAASTLGRVAFPPDELANRRALLMELDRLQEARRVVRESQAESTLRLMAMHV